MVATATTLLLVGVFPANVAAHGRMTWPHNRVGGDKRIASRTCGIGDHEWQDRQGLGELTNTCGYQNRNVFLPGAPKNCDPDFMTAILIPKAMKAGGDCSKRGTEIQWTHPWAYPGKAEVYSACGVNGGDDEHAAKAGGPKYGYDLPANRPFEWVRGSTARVGFTVNKHHGGGYQWRLCPGHSATSKPSDSCFQANPLKFATDQTTVEWADESKEKQKIPAKTLSGSHVYPANSEFRVIQIPTYYAHVDPGGYRDPPCSGCHGEWGVTHDGKFSNQEQDWDFSLVDSVEVPTDIPLGHAFLQWRWDNEEQAQVWTSCADLEIVDSLGSSSNSTVMV